MELVGAPSLSRVLVAVHKLSVLSLGETGNRTPLGDGGEHGAHRRKCLPRALTNVTTAYWITSIAPSHPSACTVCCMNYQQTYVRRARPHSFTHFTLTLTLLYANHLPLTFYTSFYTATVTHCVTFTFTVLDGHRTRPRSWREIELSMHICIYICIHVSAVCCSSETVRVISKQA